VKQAPDKCQTIAWRQTFPHPDWNDSGDAVVWIDPVKFDAAWRETEQWVSPGSASGAQDDRYCKIGEWIHACDIVNMCEVCLGEDGASFSNGRHRFAWLRDHGVAAMPFQVSPDSAAIFEALFGTPLQVSRYRPPITD